MITEAVKPEEQTLSSSNPLSPIAKAILLISLLGLCAMIVWSFLTANGDPDPMTRGAHSTPAIIDIAVLVFREGLECILVLAAITASLIGKNQRHRKSVSIGAVLGGVATMITWFIATRIVYDLSENFDALQVQAWTGLLAIVVLLVVMNWFFHKLYWGGWISMHNRKKKQLILSEKKQEISTLKLCLGFGLLGFTSFYREGFEVVLFLQSYNMKLGSDVVYLGTLIGAFFTGIVAILTFIAHHKLPYRKMLVLTGVLLGIVLLVMVGEQAEEMQLAGWIGTTPLLWLEPYIPGWFGLWFSIFPTLETLLAQGIAAALVVGSFFMAKRQSPKGASA